MGAKARFAVRMIALALLVTLGGSMPASGGTSSIDFSFRGYANNVRVVSPLVGDWQLGVASIHGSGTVGGGSEGTVVVETDPKYDRYEPALLRAQVIGYSYTASAHNTFRKLVLTVEVTRAVNGGDDCAAGVRGTLTIRDSSEKLSNGHPEDYIVMGDWTGDRCPTFVMGWTNKDGGERTRPQRGGPPDGGQWAKVRISG